MVSDSTSVSGPRVLTVPLHLQQMFLNWQTYFFDVQSQALFKLLYFHRISVSYVTLGPLDISLTGFLSQAFGGSSLQGRSQQLGCLMWDTNPLLLWEKHFSGEILPYYVLPHWVQSFWQDCVFFTPTCLSVVFLSFVVKKRFMYFPDIIQSERIHV